PTPGPTGRSAPYGRASTSTTSTPPRRSAGSAVSPSVTASSSAARTRPGRPSPRRSRPWTPAGRPPSPRCAASGCIRRPPSRRRSSGAARSPASRRCTSPTSTPRRRCGTVSRRPSRRRPGRAATGSSRGARSTTRTGSSRISAAAACRATSGATLPGCGSGARSGPPAHRRPVGEPMPDFSIPPFDERVCAFLREAGLPEDLVDPGQHRSHALAELYVLELVIDLVEQLGMTDLLARPRTAAELLEAREFVPGFRTALCWLLERLVAAGKLTRDGQGRNARYRLPAPLPASGRQAVRGEALAVDPSYTPAYALLDEAAAAYPRVARGETTGERALFQKIALWCAYFSNENRYYAINNRLGAAAAAARLGAEPACVLEVGAGLG